MRTIFLLMDSLNRHMLSAYGNDWVKTPNIDRLASRGIVFDKHYCGSMPCIPARRDMMTGRLNFLETGWGPLEPWDDILPSILRKGRGTYCHMITDHCHYFNTGAGDRYQNSFNSFEFFRGQAYDPWLGVVKPEPLPEGARKWGYGKGYYHQHLASLERRDAEDEVSYPSIQCIDAACTFVDRNHEAGNWHLHLELFSPHEPFDCPQRYLDEYGDDWQGPPATCPDYAPLDERDTPEAVDHFRKAYAATLTMIDRRLGKLFELMDQYNMWEDTAVILTTDHGYLLGEHGYWAKNYMMCYQELVHIPLIVCHPQATPGRRQALTSAIDFMPTLLDWHGVGEMPESVTGKSLTPLLREDRQHHEAVLYGYFGREVNITDGRYSYHRMPLPDSTAEYFFTDINCNVKASKEAELGTHLKHCKGIPHFCVTRKSTIPQPCDHTHRLYDIESDPGQQDVLAAPEVENRMTDQLKQLLNEADAPASQFVRLALNVESGKS